MSCWRGERGRRNGSRMTRLAEWWARFALPTLVIAESITVRMFREEWPAVECNPRQAAGDRIEPTLSRFWLPGSVIASALRRTRMVAGTTWFASQGRVEEDDAD